MIQWSSSYACLLFINGGGNGGDDGEGDGDGGGDVLQDWM